LYGTHLQTLPAAIGTLNRLRVLDLADNALTELPSEFGRLVALRYLYLHRNRLDALPEWTGALTALPQLRHLDCGRTGSLRCRRRCWRCLRWTSSTCAGIGWPTTIRWPAGLLIAGFWCTPLTRRAKAADRKRSTPRDSPGRIEG
jgi:Leucine rich repeat